MVSVFQTALYVRRPRRVRLPSSSPFAYCFNWGTRLNKMTEAIREEIKPFADMAFNMRYVGKRFDENDGAEWPVYGVFYLDDLRPKQEREAAAEK